jgi:hypothetical protein
MKRRPIARTATRAAEASPLVRAAADRPPAAREFLVVEEYVDHDGTVLAAETVVWRLPPLPPRSP